jgi:hypothetical protein
VVTVARIASALLFFLVATLGVPFAEAPARAQAAEPAQLQLTFADARPLLMLQIWSAARADAVGRSSLTARVNLIGTVTVAVLDLKAGIRAVTLDDLKRWRRSARQVFPQAERNLRARYAINGQETELEDGVAARFYAGTSFAASMALSMRTERACQGSYGALVIVPTSELMACFPVTYAHTERAVQMLSVIAARAYAEEANGISPRLYWYRRGRFIDVPYQIKDDGFDYIGTPAFDAVLARLPELRIEP